MFCRSNWPQWCIPPVGDKPGQCLADHPVNSPLCQVLGWGSVAAAGLVLVWLILLTCAVCHLRTRAGEPIYQRLDNGRVRFTWAIAQTFHRVAADTEQRSPAARSDTPANASHPNRADSDNG